MFSILCALGMVVADLLKSRARLEAEILLLRHQLNLALRHAPPRVRLRGGDRAFMVWMVRLWPSLLDVVQVVQPETVVASENSVQLTRGRETNQNIIEACLQSACYSSACCATGLGRDGSCKLKS
jgi:hypothetical protein